MKVPTRIHAPIAAAVCAALFAGCATTGTSPTLEAARSEVNAAAVQPDVVTRAPLELRTAQEALTRAERAWRDGEGREADHHAYLARTRAMTAQDLAASRRATDELAQMQSEGDRLRLAQRTREAQVARAQASQEMRNADAARADAAAARGQAATARDQAAIASQQAAIERERATLASAEAAEARRRTEVLVLELQARETERGLLVTLGDVLFVTGRADLLPTAMPRLDKLAAFLDQFPDKTLIIEGHTDSVGGDRYNQELSEPRAEAVRSALAARGIAAQRMAASGYGEVFPVASNGSPEGRAMNRRVEVVVSDARGSPRPRVSALSR